MDNFRREWANLREIVVQMDIYCNLNLPNSSKLGQITVQMDSFCTKELNYVKCGYYLRAATIGKVPLKGAATIQGRLLIKGGY